MPSGKTHDAITFLLAAPIAAAAHLAFAEIALTLVVCAAFLFGGLMFGPDLDTNSRPYARWSIARFIWFPYQKAFPHRSRWSHGLIFGTLFRVVYFFGIVTVIGAAIYLAVAGSVWDAVGFWEQIGNVSGEYFGAMIFLAAFTGTWLGAASHTITDISLTYIKTGKTGEFL
jgi:uncharacterized metal-binding protein